MSQTNTDDREDREQREYREDREGREGREKHYLAYVTLLNEELSVIGQSFCFVTEMETCTASSLHFMFSTFTAFSLWKCCEC